MTLDQAKVGDTLRITGISNPQTAMMALRLGLHEGEIVRLSSKIPGGPLVVLCGNVEIALGRELCREIEVQAE